jgi:hypothetical protein
MSNTETKFKKQHDLRYEFVIQRVAEGNFKNLWKLEVKTPTDTEPLVVCDADSLSTCIAKVGYVFESDGL